MLHVRLEILKEKKKLLKQPKNQQARMIFSSVIFSQKKFNDGNDIITVMHKKYENGKWYKNLTFIQDIFFL